MKHSFKKKEDFSLFPSVSWVEIIIINVIVINVI